MFLPFMQSIKNCRLCKFCRTVLDVIDAETACVLGRRDRKKQATRAALTAAALRLVDERGLDHVTVEDISEAADVSSRTFFNYFTSKDEALTGDNLIDSNGLRDRFLAVAPGIPVIGAILLAMRPDIEQMQADQEMWFLRMRVLTANPSLLPRLLARSTAADEQIVAAIAQRTGVGPDNGYPLLVTSVVGAAFRTAMLRWAGCGGARPLTEFVDEAFGVLATGLADPAHVSIPTQPSAPHREIPAQPAKDAP
jgi:AcrR family transcriptional regulator